MSKTKFVRFGPYKLYRDDEDLSTNRAWCGPGKDGDRIILERRRDANGYYRWTLLLLPLNETDGDIDISWSGCAYVKSPKVAAAKAWEFIEGCAEVYCGIEEWKDE